MPDDMAQEKEDLLRTLGAEVHRVPAVSIVNKGHFCRVAEQLAKTTPHAVYVDQFETLANFRAHFEGTGREVWEQTHGRLDAFVMAAGTGGTLAGVGAALRQRDPRIRIGLIDPPGSALYNKVRTDGGALPHPGNAGPTGNECTPGCTQDASHWRPILFSQSLVTDS